MKKVCIVLFVLMQALYVSAQNKNCTTPLSNDDFQLKMNEVATKDNEPAKLEAAKKIVLNNCVLASQVKQLAVTFKRDLNRLDFAKAAYNNTFDKANFYEVYDAFGFFSNVFKLHDFIKGGQTQVTETKNETKPVIKFPSWDYPDASAYKDVNGCPSILSDKDFETYANQIFETSQDPNKLKAAEAIFQKFCFSTAQIMKIIFLIKPEADKMTLLKKAFFHCYDVKNYSKTLTCVNMPNKKPLQDFINNSLVELTGNSGGNTQQIKNVPACEVLDKDFQEVKLTIKNQNFNNTRVTMCKQLIADKKCFTPFQIKEIVKLFDFEDSRLDVAKYAYDYCIDKSNFVLKVSDALEFDSSKSDLLKYVQGKNK